MQCSGFNAVCRNPARDWISLLDFPHQKLARRGHFNDLIEEEIPVPNSGDKSNDRLKALLLLFTCEAALTEDDESGVQIGRGQREKVACVCRDHHELIIQSVISNLFVRRARQPHVWDRLRVETSVRKPSYECGRDVLVQKQPHQAALGVLRISSDLRGCRMPLRARACLRAKLKSALVSAGKSSFNSAPETPLRIKPTTCSKGIRVPRKTGVPLRISGSEMIRRFIVYKIPRFRFLSATYRAACCNLD